MTEKQEIMTEAMKLAMLYAQIKLQIMAMDGEEYPGPFPRPFNDRKELQKDAEEHFGSIPTLMDDAEVFAQYIRDRK